jgi:hypothetical protein
MSFVMAYDGFLEGEGVLYTVSNAGSVEAQKAKIVQKGCGDATK